MAMVLPKLEALPCDKAALQSITIAHWVYTYSFYIILYAYYNSIYCMFDSFTTLLYLLTAQHYSLYARLILIYMLQEFQNELDAKSWDYDIVRTSCEWHICSLKDFGEHAQGLEVLCNQLFFEWTDLSRCSFEIELAITEAINVCISM